MRFKRKIQSRLTRTFMVMLLMGGLAMGVASNAHAQGSDTREFMGHEINGSTTSYVVIRDVNLRAGPDTTSRRVGGLKEGQEVISPGRHQGWIAIEDDGQPVGFAYLKYLQPFIDGTLFDTVSGTVIVGPRSCDYDIAFAGKTKPSGEAFQFADYNIAVACSEGDKELAFDLFAFMSEGPYARGKDTVHQIGIDLLAIAEDYDHVLSTIILFDHDKQQIDFDQITLDEFARKPAFTQADATTVPDALEQAVRMTLSAWNDKVWEELSKAQG